MNILVIRFSALGDLVTLEPTFRAFKHFFPEAHITLLTSSLGKELYTDTPYFDAFIVHKKILSTLKNTASKHFDIVFNLQCNKPSHYLNLFIHKKQTINKSFSLWQKIFKIKTHSKNAQELLLKAGIDTTALENYFKQKEAYCIQLPSQKNKVIPKSIAIATGCSPRWPSKQWGLERYKALIATLLQHHFHITLVGSKLEEADAHLLSMTFPNIDNRVNKTSLSELKTLLANVTLFVGNDSGPTHLAAAVGTDTLSIFGSTDIKFSPKFAPNRGTHLCISPPKTIQCHPCYKGVCPTHHECMQAISVEEVTSLILNHFKEVK